MYPIIRPMLSDRAARTRTTPATIAPPRYRRTLLVLVTMAIGFAACAEQTTRAVSPGLEGRPHFAIAVPEGMSLQCAPRPTVAPRVVEPGAEHDLNGNGIVCDETVGPRGVHDGGATLPVATTDDIPLPIESSTP